MQKFVLDLLFFSLHWLRALLATITTTQPTLNPKLKSEPHRLQAYGWARSGRRVRVLVYSASPQGTRFFFP